MEFIEWLKYFGLNFFAKKTASESKKRSVWNGILAFCIAIALMYGALCVGTLVSFSSRYNNSDDFTDFYRGIFKGSDGIRLEISNRKMSALDDSGERVMINTFKNHEDKEKYSANGYELIIDTRDCGALYSDFEAIFISTDDSSRTISYDEYQDLSSSSKESYYAKLVLSENEIVFTEDLINGYVSYITQNGDSDAVASLHELDVNNPDSYADIYELYYNVKYSKLGTGFSSVPTVRDYYINTYLATDESGKSIYNNYVIFLYDLAFASWHTNNGIRIVATGYYSDNDIRAYDGDKSTDQLIVDLYRTNSDVIKINYFLYMLRAISLIGLVWMVLPLVSPICGHIFKKKVFPTYSAVFKTMGGFWIGSVLPSIIFALAGSFSLSQATVFYISIGIVIIINIFRTLLQFIPDIVHSNNVPNEV